MANFAETAPRKEFWKSVENWLLWSIWVGVSLSGTQSMDYESKQQLNRLYAFSFVSVKLWRQAEKLRGQIKIFGTATWSTGFFLRPVDSCNQDPLCTKLTWCDAIVTVKHTQQFFSTDLTTYYSPFNAVLELHGSQSMPGPLTCYDGRPSHYAETPGYRVGRRRPPHFCAPCIKHQTLNSRVFLKSQRLFL